MTWRSRCAPVEVGGPTPDAMVRATAARVPHRPALVDGASGDGVTYAELVRRADRAAALLAERGLGPGTSSRSGSRTCRRGRAWRSARCARVSP